MYKSKTLHTFLFSIVLFLTANVHCQAQSNNATEAWEKTINENYALLTQYIKDGDPAAIASNFYTKDAKFFPPTGGVVEGREAIAKAFGGLIQAGLVIAPKAVEVENYGEAIYEYGIATLYNKEGEELGKERYIVIWKMEDGRWKMYRDFVKGQKMK
jgi:ketosteroid isomerase-like protein